MMKPIRQPLFAPAMKQKMILQFLFRILMIVRDILNVLMENQYYPFAMMGQYGTRQLTIAIGNGPMEMGLIVVKN